MSFFDEVEKHFGCRCLYTALDLKKDATEKEIKRAYHKFSLLCHPDRSSEIDKEANKVKFQTLGKIHAILSNSEQKNVYDETGEILDESDILSQDRDWESYWRILFKKVTKKDLEQFENEYKGSEKEMADLKNYYVQFEGDMDKILDNVMCSTVDDESRFAELISKWIADGDVPDFENFSKEDKDKKKKRKRQAKKEAAEAEELAKELAIDKEGDLENLILARRKNREQETNDFFASLEAKYCQKENKRAAQKGSKSTKRKRK